MRWRLSTAFRIASSPGVRNGVLVPIIPGIERPLTQYRKEEKEER